ncbi:TPA: hypothetical protein PWK54_004043 [Escherichia coli]|uniref:Uncharacterized protein n=6 Tax=Enterobacterales TaxID=91347 RepID=A0A6M3NYE9_SALET|nr:MULTISPECIES: hypothetical protein [Enterobacterales]EAA7227378.1 hypothetical protein [Salmonella enterica subsp. enterica serovar Senftenberg]EAM5576416.1 hypothetical protein [Salmonella enterica subsp. enterica serovar Adelaide]EBH8678734.1 hypothetical protein [Salmonella enterica subsp. enterica serovar 4,[5],12:i:-]EBL5147096.1 hypothetical protein [Salmonella enterica subsp. enterica serovar Schwarzengrund]EBS5850473.1 hypothetical protein [Salmonella enterica subsp. enterica serova
MIVSEAIFYSSIISWVLYWWFIGNITKKVGMLVVPLTLTFGCYIYAIHWDDSEQQTNLGWEQIGFITFIIVIMWAGKFVMKRLSE